ncbi:MAG: molybdopterin molybdotransferase MoeA [Pseudomonadales bacterium]|nr:molybdopterin molybdotransferase MoeA [Pseudomonadales bacterium]
MDGYALRASSRSAAGPFHLEIVGSSLAGHPFEGTIADGQCVRITTGAPLPHDADAVVIQENCVRSGDRLLVNVSVAAGEHVREVGNDIHQGDNLLLSGQLINAFDVGWLAACGIERIKVFRRVRVAVFSTGDELQEPGTPLQRGRIFDSNRMTLLQLLRELPVRCEDLGILPDDPQHLRTTLSRAARDNDLILTSGGVSVGDADHVREVVAAIGRIDFWRLNLKPGKPLAFGRINDAIFLGLPGNPVSTIVTYLLVAQPALRLLAGAGAAPVFRYQARLKHRLHHQPGREEYQRGYLVQETRELTVGVRGDQSSNRLGSFSGADCLIRIPAETADLEPGELVEVLPFRGIGN